MKPLTLTTTLCAAVALAACAEYDPPETLALAPAYAVDAAATVPAGACFMTRDIQNHTIGDDRTLYINVMGRDVYRVEMSNSCLGGYASSDPLVIRNLNSSMSVCRPIDLDVGITSHGMPSHCIVSSITHLAPAQVAALPDKLRP